MPQFRKLSPADLLSRKHSGQDKIKNGRLMIHAAGGNAEDGDERGVRSGEFGANNCSFFLTLDP